MDKTQTNSKVMGYSLDDIFTLNDLDPDEKEEKKNG